MGAVELRNKVIDKVQDADERLLKVLDAVLDSYQETEVVAYTVDGKPLTLEEYTRELHEAKAEYNRGEFITTQDLKKEIKSW